MYETVIANVVELGQLKEFDEEAKRVFVADHLSFKAIRFVIWKAVSHPQRCFFVGLSYMNIEKWHEAMALFSRCETHLRTAIDHHDTADAKLSSVVCLI